MRIAALIFGILGGLAMGFLGFKWFSDSQGEDAKAVMALGGAFAAELSKLVTASYVMMAAALLGIIGGVIASKGNKLGGVLMLVAAIAPFIFVPGEQRAGLAVFASPLILGGIFGLLAKPKAVAVAAA